MQLRLLATAPQGEHLVLDPTNQQLSVDMPHPSVPATPSTLLSRTEQKRVKAYLISEGIPSALLDRLSDKERVCMMLTIDGEQLNLLDIVLPEWYRIAFDQNWRVVDEMPTNMHAVILTPKDIETIIRHDGRYLLTLSHPCLSDPASTLIDLALETFTELFQALEDTDRTRDRCRRVVALDPMQLRFVPMDEIKNVENASWIEAAIKACPMAAVAMTPDWPHPLIESLVQSVPLCYRWISPAVSDLSTPFGQTLAQLVRGKTSDGFVLAAHCQRQN